MDKPAPARHPCGRERRPAMQTHRPLAAALWMSGSILSFTGMAIA